jgi:hypothetical protein
VTFPFTLPPIIERELRVASRRAATYWGRVGAAAAGVMIVCFVLLAQVQVARPGVAGQFTFRLLAAVGALVVVTSVLRLSSVAFAREKREDTLGLLFLTPLRPIEIVSGKLLSTALPAFYEFVAVVPLLSVPMLMGGVTAADFALLVLALANWVFLGATLGLYVSARSWDEKRATSIASALMLAVAMLVPALGVAIATALDAQDPLTLCALSPAFAVWHAVFPRLGGSLPMWGSLLWTHLLGWMFFRAAWRTLPQCWQNRPANSAPRGEHLHPSAASASPAAFAPDTSPKRAKTRRTVGRPITDERRARILDQNPIIWMALRWRPDASGLWVIGLIGVVGGVPALVLGFSTSQWGPFFHPGFALFVFYWINLAFKTFVATQASFAFARDRAENPLDLLLSTPITSRQLMDGFGTALRQTLRSWVLRALVLETGWLAFTLVLHAWHGGQNTVHYVLGMVAIVGFLVPDLYAVGWAALWRSVIAKGAREADKEAFSEALFFPWMPAGVVWLATIPWMEPENAAIVFIITWMLASAANDWWHIRQARHKLETRLFLWAQRRAAGELEHYDGWRRLGRWLGRWWSAQSRGRHANEKLHSASG